MVTIVQDNIGLHIGSCAGIVQSNLSRNCAGQHRSAHWMPRRHRSQLHDGVTILLRSQLYSHTSLSLLCNQQLSLLDNFDHRHPFHCCAMSAHVLQVLRQTSSKNEELMMLLQYGLPIWNQRAWHKVDQFHAMLRAGGLPSLPNVIVSKAFRSNHTNKLNIAKNKSQNKTWYCFDHENRFYDTPLDQLLTRNSAVV